VYAQNLLPCLLSIGKRKEPLVIESLQEFMKSYAKNLLNCLTEGETAKLVDMFMENLSVDFQRNKLKCKQTAKESFTACQAV
jgi:huntingtin